MAQSYLHYNAIADECYHSHGTLHEHQRCRLCRVAEDGSLPDVQATPSLSEQFRLHCAMVRRLTRGFPWKVPNSARCCSCYWPGGVSQHSQVLLLLALVQRHTLQVVAHKAYLRTNTGNHRVVTARTAAGYFGPVPPGERSPRCESSQQISSLAFRQNCTRSPVHDIHHLRDGRAAAALCTGAST
jgi:hypothetical protein